MRFLSSKRRIVRDNVPLHVFVRRQQVLELYRKMQKGAQSLEDKALGTDIRSQIRHEFKHNASLTDNMALRNLMQDAQRNLVKLQSMSQHSSRRNDGTSWLNAHEGDADDERGRLGKGWPWK